MDELPTISLRPSRLAVKLIALATGCALSALVISGLSLESKLPAILLVFAMGLREYRHQSPWAFAVLGCTQGTWWVLVENNKREVELCGEQLVLPWLVVLQFRESGCRRWRGKRSVAIWRDSVSAEDHRRLRVALRFARR